MLVLITYVQCVRLATEPGISLIIFPLMKILLLRVATIRRTTDTFLFISHTTKGLLFKFRCSIFIAGFGSKWDTLYITIHGSKKVKTGKHSRLKIYVFLV